MKHSQDKGGSPASRAVQAITTREGLDYAEGLREAAIERRNFDLEERRSALYEELRLLTKTQLEQRAGYSAARQVLIADILHKEVPK